MCAGPLANRIATNCNLCRNRLKLPFNQHKGFFPDERMLIRSPPFSATAMDFLGPFQVKALSNAKCLLKTWPIVFGCLNTGAIHVELNQTYGTDALLLSISSFIAIRGYPSVFYTDHGTQLCKAGEFIESQEEPAN